ncbi:MAG TPA: hypothetical protein VEY51_02325, partial [Chondromyces sp.]|nr:hypothetical protein [Chondromyces sp.]
VRGAAGEVLPPGEAGTIYVKSSMLFSGYIMDSMLENVQDADGWVTVHDAGYLDEDGFLYLVGREKNMIISGGINIFPEEIEAVVKKHPNVTEAVVVGMPDSYWGEVLLAFYSGQVAPAELKRHCRQYLSAYKVPRIWKRIDSFPYTSSGKVARQKLKEEVQYA